MDLVRITLGLLFAFNVITLVILTASRCVVHFLPTNFVIVAIAVNIFIDAMLFYVLF